MDHDWIDLAYARNGVDLLLDQVGYTADDHYYHNHHGDNYDDHYYHNDNCRPR
ncbi:MAG: hypothetical protein ABSB96_09710 [Gaiellaceae bacterium]